MNNLGSVYSYHVGFVIKHKLKSNKPIDSEWIELKYNLLHKVDHRIGSSGTSYNTRAPDSKVPGANMGPIWGRQDPGGPHVGPRNFAIWGQISEKRDCIWETNNEITFTEIGFIPDLPQLLHCPEKISSHDLVMININSWQHVIKTAT